MGVYTPPAYVFALADASGVLAANNFLSVFNPANSGRALALLFLQGSSYTATTAIVDDSMLLYRTTAASAGTDSSADIVKLKTSADDPVAVVRTANPTLTLGSLVNAISPPLSSGSFTSGNAIIINAVSATTTLILAEGEGFALRTEAGDVDQRWNLTVAWAEL